MLFNSYPFLFLYLPLTLLTFLILRRWHRSLAIGGLILASLIFYGVWNPRDVLLLLGSIFFNFWIGQRLQKPPSEMTPTGRRLWLQLGIENDEARRIAEDAGIAVVMDRCIMVDHRALKEALP